ncbi:hypothetical protein ACFX1X_013042 [Malus domestica]
MCKNKTLKPRVVKNQRRGAGCFSTTYGHVAQSWIELGTQPPYDVASRTVTGSTPRSGGGKNPKATPSFAPHPTRATVSSPSSPTLPQNPACFTGRRRRDGCSKGTKRYMSAVSTTRDSEC